MEQFSVHFLNELFRLALLKKDVVDVVCNHLDYEMIPVQLKQYKQILKNIKAHWELTSTLPTIGMLHQSNSQNEQVILALEEISKAKVVEKEIIFKILEDYIKRVKFQLLYTEIAEVYNSGDQAKAIKIQAEKSQEISNFSIFKGTDVFESVFDNFYKRDEERFMIAQDPTLKSVKIPFGIDILDKITYGGSDKTLGETDCFLGRSGSGKTKWLRWQGVSAARRGYKVLHIQAEGTKKECLLGYDATWTSILKKDLKVGYLPEEFVPLIRKVLKDIKLKGGNIEVIAFEQFGEPSMKDVRDFCLQYYKKHGVFPDKLILDYLELFHPGNTRRYGATTEGEKYKREDSARAFKNICNEFSISGSTAAQANDIAPADFNRQEWYMTRHNVAGAKGLIDSFSYFYTWNVSSDEYKKGMGRLYADKMRDFMGGHLIRICTDFDHDRFYNRPETMKTWPEDYNLK